jgi:hypothetical protein
MGALFESLDYIYTPAPDFEAAVRLYTGTLQGKLCWRIRDGSTWVAAVRLVEPGPIVLLASHLEPGHAILIYRVSSIDAVRERLAADGWPEPGEPFEIPQGPCLVLSDPGRLRIAVYERVRPWIDETFNGRFD